MYFDKNTLFPGYNALVPVLGTALVIIYGQSGTFVARFLSFRPFIFIGLISYSAYLFHQPIFAFFRVASPNALTRNHYLIAIVATIAFAALSWKFVEEPFRRRTFLSRKTIFLCTGFASVFLAFAGIAMPHLSDLAIEENPEQREAFDPPKAMIGDCKEVIPGLNEKILHCKLGRSDKAPTLALVGDSHADAIAGVLSDRLKGEGLSGIQFKIEGCQSLPTVSDIEGLPAKRIEDCSKAIAELLAYLKQSSIRTIIVINRWTYKFYPIPEEIEELAFNNGEGGVEGDLPPRRYFAQGNADALDSGRNAKEKAIRTFIDAFISTGKSIFLIYPIPEVGWHIPKLNFKYARGFFGKQPERAITTSFAIYLKRNAFILEIFDSIIAPNLVKFRPSETLCTHGEVRRCFAQREDGRPLYFDDDHLSRLGVELLFDDQNNAGLRATLITLSEQNLKSGGDKRLE